MSMDMLIFRAVPPADLAALALFCLLWLGYSPFVRAFAASSINAGLHPVRVLWMRSMLGRDNRVTDASLIGHVVHSATFFASTSLIAIGALLGTLTGLDRLEGAIAGLSLSAPVAPEFARLLLELKVLLPLAVLVHGLFELTWALRQMNYMVALMGAMPPAPLPAELVGELAEEAGGVLSSALATFNDGIRSYYFAIAGLTWLAGPWALMAASVGLGAVLVHRQLGSSVARRFRKARALVETAHASRPAAGKPR
jgi:uncharacterized membrane protein